jgi:DNA adenine methylase
MRMAEIKRRQPQQLLKWIGSKHRFAPFIVEAMPDRFDTYYEPFVGTGAVLGCLRPSKSVAGDTLKPLIDLWNLVKNDPETVARFYHDEIDDYSNDPRATYSLVKDRFNKAPNPLDLLFISRTCYGGVIRFTKEGKISTPIGPHKPISSATFSKRLMVWHKIVENTQFFNQSYEITMKNAREGDVVYCDPPYLYCQSILYGSQNFKFEDLMKSIQECKDRGAKILLSIDGSKKSNQMPLQIDFLKDLFERELVVDCGKSMLRRLQLKGEIQIGEDVHDRLLLTW